MTLEGAQELGKENEERQTTRIFLMRHGPTPWNKAKRIQGNIDIGILTDEVDDYLQKLASDPIPQPDIIFVSELQRTRQTADRLTIFKQWHGIPIKTEPRLNERKWGILEGKTHEEAKSILLHDFELLKLYPDLPKLDNLSVILDAEGFKVTGGESLQEVEQRARAAVNDLQQKYPKKTVLVVTHAGVLISLGLDLHQISKIEPDASIF